MRQYRHDDEVQRLSRLSTAGGTSSSSGSGVNKKGSDDNGDDPPCDVTFDVVDRQGVAQHAGPGTRVDIGTSTEQCTICNQAAGKQFRCRHCAVPGGFSLHSGQDGNSAAAAGVVRAGRRREATRSPHGSDHSPSMHLASWITGDTYVGDVGHGDDASSRGLGASIDIDSMHCEGLGASGDMKPVELAEPHGENEAGEQQGMGNALVPKCTSSVKKCKGRYRITMKGVACHGKACCGGI